MWHIRELHRGLPTEQLTTCLATKNFYQIISQARLLFAFDVMVSVGFRGFVSVVLGLPGTAARYHPMVCSFFSRSGFIMFGRFAVMLRSRLEMLGSALVVLCNFGCGRSHKLFLLNLPTCRTAWL